MKTVDIYQVDAFTDVVFGGNPAGVVPDATGLSEETMQKVAREMALSETAFIIDTRGKGPADFDVRFFTPLAEVDLCGHATIGSFWLLAELGMIGEGPQGDAGEVRVHQLTKAGRLPVDISFGCEGAPSRIMMTQNLPEVVGQPSREELHELERILGAPEGCITGFERATPQVVSTGLPDLIVPVTSREALLSMRPNMAAVADFCVRRGIISVHCLTLETLDPASTIHCRDFSPSVGVPEESATGTASGATGAYLVLNRLVEVKEPVTKIICEQGHILKRPSLIHVEVASKAGEITSVRVGGSAVTVIRGSIAIGD
jgi:trans-2,3-dihydro-3-hydroxyanthranilate isomerase